MQISETKVRPVKPGSVLENTTGSEHRHVGIKIIRTRVHGSPIEPNPEQPLTIRHTIMRDALMASLKVPPEGAEAIGKRLQLLLGLGLRRKQEQSPGRGRGYINGLAEALDAAFAFTLQRAFIPPSAVVSLMLDQRSLLDARWAAAARGERSKLTIAIDALARTGQEGIRTGRFTEDPRGSVTLAGALSRKAELASAPTIIVNFTELYRVTVENLRRVGVPTTDLERAGDMIAADEKIVSPQSHRRAAKPAGPQRRQS